MSRDIVPTSTSRRRPGPFGPAWALLPQDQQQLVLEDTATTGDAIERMMDTGFSQIRYQLSIHPKHCLIRNGCVVGGDRRHRDHRNGRDGCGDLGEHRGERR